MKLSGYGFFAALGLLASCGDEPAASTDTTPPDTHAGDAADTADSADTAPAPDVADTPDVPVGPDPGALIRVSATSKVGYLLEEVPADLRDAVAAQILAKPESFWRARAEMHLAATRYRLGYRRLFTFLVKGALALPPDSVRTLTLDPAGPERTTIDGHDVVAIGYTMTGTLLTDTESVAISEPELATIGGTWVEGFLMPVDPDLLMQRTGLSCIRELAETSDLLDAENALRFYDDKCTATDLRPFGCHNAPVAQSCEEALRAHIGAVELPLTFERLPWDAALADAVRIPFATQGAPDLKVLPNGLANHQILWSYIAPDSCAVFEGCVRGSGWRRLLRFDASLENVGSEDLVVGPLDGSPFVDHNVFEFSACHEHYHFRFYGDFSLENAAGDKGMGDKRAFCLLSTSRYANNERVPLAHEHDYCNNQGILRGWGDDYYAGLDCQWIDITDVPVEGETETMSLGFAANPAGFLCEGTPVTDERGAQVFTSTEFVGEGDKPIDRPECTQSEGYADNNWGEAPVVVPDRGSIVTLPCGRGQLGPRRDCGFTEQPDILTCTPGEPVAVSCTVGDLASGQVVRLCETSAVHETPIACTFRESLASALVRGEAKELTFTCPAARGTDEPGGTWAIYHAPVLDGAAGQAVTCAVK